MSFNKKLLIIFYILFSNFLYAEIGINPIKQECISSLDNNDSLNELIKLMENSIPSRDYDLLKKINWKFATKETSFIARAEYSKDTNTYTIELHKNMMKIFCGITTDLIQFYTMQSVDDASKKAFGFDLNDSEKNILGFNFHKKLNIPIQQFLLKSGWKECVNSKFSQDKCKNFSKEVIKPFIEKKDYKQYAQMLEDGRKRISDITVSSIVFVLVHEFAHHALGHTQEIEGSTLSLESIRKKEYEADSYARISLHRGNLENISTAFSFDLFSILDFLPTSSIEKMNYTNKLTHESSECRTNLVIIDSIKSEIVYRLFQKMINISEANPKYITKKEIISSENKMLEDTGMLLKYIDMTISSSKKANCNFDKKVNSKEISNEYAELLLMIGNIRRLAYQKNYKQIVNVLENNITRKNKFSDFTQYSLIEYSVHVVNSFYRLKDKSMKTKISFKTSNKFFIEIYDEIGYLDIVTTARILNSLLYNIMASNGNFDEKVILLEQYAKKAINYNPKLSESYAFLAEVEIYKRNRAKALEYYILAYETSADGSTKNMLKDFILELQDTTKKLRENTVLKSIHDTSVKNTNKENNSSIELLIPNETQKNFPLLVKMLIDSTCMDNKERNYWFNAIPSMSTIQVAELIDILETGKRKLDKIDLKYSMISSADNIQYIFEKVKEDKKNIDDSTMEELIYNMNFVHKNKLTDSIYQKFLNKFESIKNRVQSKDKYYYLLARFYLVIGKYDKSLNRAEESIKINPKNYRVYYDMGKAYESKKDYDKAIKFYQKAITLNPKDENLYNDIGRVYWNIQQYDESLYSYQEAIKINSKNVDFYYNIGIIYSDIKKEYKKAIKILNEGMILSPKDTNLISLLANTYAKINNYDKAISLCKKALKINSKNSYTYQVLASIYIFKKDYKKSIKIYKKLLKINPNDISIYTDFFELQLIQKLIFDKEMEKKYISKFKDKKEKFIHYEMLKIFENIIVGNEINLKNWQEKYKDTQSTWNFDILDEWVEAIQDKLIKKELLEALKVFKNHKIRVEI